MNKPRIDNDHNIWYTRLVLNVIGNPNNRYISIHYTSGDPLAPDYHCCLIKYGDKPTIIKCMSLSDFYEKSDAEMKKAFQLPTTEIALSNIKSATYIQAPDLICVRDLIKTDERLAEIFDLLVQDGNRDMVSNVLKMTGEQDGIIRS